MKPPEFREGCVIPGTPYQIVAILGSGTLGSVYAVVHRELGRRFVLRAFDAPWTDRGELVRRLRGQWRALAELEHPSLVAVTDAGCTESGVPFVVMEWLEGETLETRLGRAPVLTTAEAVDIALGMATGLEAAHGIGIVHGAIKPSNVFLAGATIKLLDCALGPMAASLRAPREPGTGRYTAPEQAAGRRIEARTDLFSLGVVLFEMLTGIHPFGAAGETDTGVSRVGPPATRLTSVLAGADPALEAVVGGLLERDARSRPENARVVIRALVAVAERCRKGAGAGSASQLSEPTERDARRGDAPPDIAALGGPTRQDARFDGDTIPDGLGDGLATAETFAPPWSSRCSADAAVPTAREKTMPLSDGDRPVPRSVDDPGPTRTAAVARRLPGEGPPAGSGSPAASSTRARAGRRGLAKRLVGFGVAAVAVAALAMAWLSRSPAPSAARGPTSRQPVAAVRVAPADARAAPAPAGAVVPVSRDASAPAPPRPPALDASTELVPTAARRVAPDTSRRRARRPRTHSRTSEERPREPAEALGGASTPASQTGTPAPVLPGSGL